jgi:O-antigen/teichoic acid export membrane protein
MATEKNEAIYERSGTHSDETLNLKPSALNVSDIEISWDQLRRWTVRGGLAVADQGLFSGTSFILNILLARWLSPEDYGAFAVAFSIFVLLSSIHTALLTEPMLVFGRGKYADQQNRYFAMLIYGHIGVTLLFGGLTTLGAFVAGGLISRSLQWSLIGLGIATPMILLLWLVRRTFYVRLQPASAAAGGILYMVVLVGSVLLLQSYGWLSNFSAYLVMGGVAFIVSVVFLAVLRPQWAIVGSPTPAMVADDHWKYGRWALALLIVNWMPWNLHILVLSLILPIREIAALRALYNVILPVIHVLIALAGISLPLFAERFRNRPGERTQLVKLFASLSAGIAICYTAFLFLVGPKALEFVYKENYPDVYDLAPILAFAQIPLAVIMTFGLAYAALARSDKALRNYLPYVALTLILGLIGGVLMHVRGVVYGFLVSSFLGLLASYVFFRKTWPQLP